MYEKKAAKTCLTALRENFGNLILFQDRRGHQDRHRPDHLLAVGMAGRLQGLVARLEF